MTQVGKLQQTHEVQPTRINYNNPANQHKCQCQFQRYWKIAIENVLVNVRTGHTFRTSQEFAQRVRHQELVNTMTSIRSSSK